MIFRKMDQTHIYIMQILFLGGITFGSNTFNLNNKHQLAVSVARFVLYILTINVLKGGVSVIREVCLKNHAPIKQVLRRINQHHAMMYIVSIAFLFLNEQNLFRQDFLLIFTASLIVKYFELPKSLKSTVTYGVGMACSYFEGYLTHVLPSDGAKFVGFEENIAIYENREGVVFPVKKLFIIITKSLFCPPDLKEFNRSNKKGAATIEACKSLEERTRDVAGVRARVYRNTAYRVYRARGRPVSLAAECATPLHTLYRVLRNRHLYQELADVNQEDIVNDFVTTLRKILDKSPECRNKCEIVCIDDTDPEMNLADVLLDRIRELEPNFEELIATRRS